MRQIRQIGESIFLGLKINNFTNENAMYANVN